VPLDQLLAALERDAREQADCLLAEAHAEAERITSAADQDIARRRDATVGARQREGRAVLEQTLSKARRAARRGVLEARDRLLARTFAAARAALPAAIETPAYQASLPLRVEAALAYFDKPERVVLRCPPPLARTIAAAVSGRTGVRVTPDAEVGSGFRVATTDDAVEVDDTLETRLAARRRAFALGALEQLVSAP
jgi:vacuolar-type H+-ATPase subunit E/Vma4